MFINPKSPENLTELRSKVSWHIWENPPRFREKKVTDPYLAAANQRLQEFIKRPTFASLTLSGSRPFGLLYSTTTGFENPFLKKKLGG